MRSIKLAVIITLTLGIVGCAVLSSIWEYIRNNCDVTGGGIRCGLGATYVQQQRASNFTQQELAQFSGSAVEIDIGQGNAVLESFGDKAYVTLLSGSTPVATTSVDIQISNGIVTVSDPTALESWIQTYGLSANGFDVELEESDFYIQEGPNIVTSEWRYDSDVVGGDSFAHYGNPNDPGCCVSIKALSKPK